MGDLSGGFDLRFHRIKTELAGHRVGGAALLPADTTGFGFDNNADVLSVSPGLLERYLGAARKVSRLALGDPSVKPGLQTYSLPYMVLLQDARMGDDLPFGSRGGTAIRHMFPVDGEYLVRVTLQRGYLATEPRGLPTAEQVDIRLDGERLGLMPVGGPDSVGPDPYSEAPRPAADGGLFVRFATKAGLHTVSVSFQNRTWAPEGIGPSRFPAASFGTQHAKGSSVSTGRVEMAVDSVHVEGPFKATRPAMTDSRRRIFVCEPASPARESACAKTILSKLARRAYRRAATADDVATLMEFYKTGRAEAGFDAGIQRALERILISPYFIYRVEEDPAGVAPGAAYRISDVELASRLSFFLWSSIPDETLLDVALAGRLREPAVLAGQVRRMLADSRSRAFTQNFFSQWLFTRNMRLHRPDQKAFMDFDENLREAFQQETQLFLESQIRENRPVTELITANYSFLNERLARHYGIPHVYGNHFRRVTLPDSAHRGGILNHGSVLTVTSYADRTSVVLRGKFILENILGTPPPAPPANVPALENTKVEGSLRQKMEMHRKNPVCANCHAQLDPMGFAFENFSGIGKWRTEDGKATIDPSGGLPDGTKFDGPAGFRDALAQKRDIFTSTMTSKLLTYALGRGLEPADMPVIRQLLRDTEAAGNTWSTLILNITKSLPFQMRRAES